MCSTPMRYLCAMLGLLVCLVRPVFAAAAYPQIVPSVPDIDVYNTIGMIPLAQLAEQFGLMQRVDRIDGSMTVTAGNHAVNFIPDSKRLTCDGKYYTLPVAPYQTNSGLFYVPALVCMQGLGGTMAIDAQKSLCLLNLPGFAQPLAVPYVMHTEAKGPIIESDLELFVATIDGSTVHRLTCDSADNGLPVFLPNSMKFYYSRNGAIMQRTADDAAETPLPKPKDGEKDLPYFPCAASSDGKLLLFQQTAPASQHASLFMLHIGDSEAKLISREGYAPCMSPDGKTLACLQQNDGKTGVYLMAANGSGRRCIEENASDAFHPLFNADGSLLAYQRAGKGADGRPCRKIVIYQLTGDHAGKCYLSADTPQDDECYAAFSADGKSLLIAGSTTGLQLMKPDRTESTQLVKTAVTHPIFTPDSAQILFTAGSTLHRMNRDGANHRVLLNNIDIIDLTLTPDGKQVVMLAKPAAPTDDGTKAEKK